MAVIGDDVVCDDSVCFCAPDGWFWPGDIVEGE
jgi:hypothetical protein